MTISPPGSPEVVDVAPSTGAPGRCLVWRFDEPMRAISSAVLGGGVRGDVGWVLNMTVDGDYARHDPADHLAEVAGRLGLHGAGVGLMTAVDVASWSVGRCDGATAAATVGIRSPVWAADVAPVDDGEPRPGTINVVAWCPVALSPSALVNAIATVTEAKVQALIEHGVAGTGTASDALCIVCPAALDGDGEPFGGPRSAWGSRLAIAAHAAIAAGVAKQRTALGGPR